MKRIADYRRLLGVTANTDLRELKTVYRNLMKEWHPDKFQDNEEKKLAAEDKSKHFITAYHFLVSIHPETKEQLLPVYKETLATANIANYSYEKMILQIDFADGTSYEYFEVPKNLYIKLVNSDVPARFCRRHIYHEFLYRKVSKAVEA